MDSDQIRAQQEIDRKEFADLPPGVNKPLSWCSAHECRLGTCFPLHYPESYASEQAKSINDTGA